MSSATSRLMTRFLFLLSLCLILPFFREPYLTPKLLFFSLGCILAYRLHQLEIRPLSPMLLPIILLPILTLFLAVDKLTAFQVIMTACVVLAPSVVCLSEKSDDWTFIVFWSVMAICLTGFLQWLGLGFFPQETENLPSSLMGNSLVSGLFVTTALWFLPQEHAYRRWAIVPVLVFVFLTQSKTVIAGFILFAVFQLPWPRSNFQKKLSVSALLLGLGFIWVSLQPTGFVQSIKNPDQYISNLNQQAYLLANRAPLFKGKPYSLLSRLILWSNSSQMLKTHPLIGWGAGQFKTQYPRFSQASFVDPNLNGMYRPESPHNSLLAGAIQFGILWVLLWLYALVAIGKSLKNTNHRMAWIWVWTTTLWQPLLLMSPVFFLFLGAPSKQVTSSRFIGLLAMGLLSISSLFLVLTGFKSSLYLSLWSKCAPDSTVGSLVKSTIPPTDLANYFLETNDVQQANRELLRALKKDPYSPDLLYNFVLTLPTLSPDRKAKLEAHRIAFPYFRPRCEEGKMRTKESHPPISDLAPLLSTIPSL